jgi:hypothetical protein
VQNRTEHDTDHYFVGLSQQLAAGGLARLGSHGSATLPASRVYPMGQRFSDFVRPIVHTLRTDEHVREIILRPVLGRYGISQELSVGLEVHAGAGFNAAGLAASVFTQALSARQTDAFVGRVLAADEWTDNARPGLTILFREPRRIALLNPLLHRITEFPGEGWSIDGFTTIPAGDGRIGTVLGLRYLFLPEISIRWDLSLRARLADDPDEVDIILLDQATKIGRLCRELQRDPDIAEARLNWFDVMVAGIEDYPLAIDKLALERQTRTASSTSMARKPFSEILELTNVGVLRKRLAMLEVAEAQRLSLEQARTALEPPRPNDSGFSRWSATARSARVYG